ncbi:MAG: thiamine pyrophosphate-binding protein [Gemmataceae bacterium]|nr:thiamine pyrophosphate-binding protein [Gemmataceae bacterium]
MTGADLLVHSLYAAGVRVIFGMPGSHTVAIYDAIERHSGIRTILIRNEQAGAFAADGYARVTGQPGVICTTAGPGATNALTGIGEAWADSVPVLLIAGQVNHDRLHQECGNYHEIDLESILRPCTKYVGTVMDNQQIPAMVAQAFHAMTVGRPRPAALVLPQDLMAASFSPLPPGEGPGVRVLDSGNDLERIVGLLPNPLTPGPSPGGRGACTKAAALLAQAKKPILLAGGGAVWANAGPELRQLAERLNCPVITSLNAKGILDERDPLSLGHARSAKGKAATTHADAMLAVGCRFTEVMTGFRKLPVPARLIQIDINPGEIGMNHPAEIGIVADAKEALQAILAALPATTASDWSDIWPTARSAKLATSEWLIDTLRAELPDDAVVFTDASEMAYRMHTDYPAYMPRSFFYPSNYIALGWGFPGAVGAACGLALGADPAIAKPQAALVVSFSGDGGFVMTCQELATAARYQLRMIIIVHNDNAYGAIKHLQRLKFEERYRDTELNNPDFLELAHAFGIPARRVEGAASFADALREALDQRGPFLIEVPDQWRYLRH